MPASPPDLQELPHFYQRRTRVVSKSDHSDGEFVLYWMCMAARTEENPALDVARCAAFQAKLPLLVYHGLSYRYPYASDRHHQFILEGARDVEAACREQGISYLFHLERPGDPAVLKELSARAALVVTENFPTPPIRRWVHALQAQPSINLWCVDTACLVSLERSTKTYKRAFTFRDDLSDERKEALHTPYPDIDLPPPKPWSTLPVEGTSLKESSLSELIASCPIDHTIPPVKDTVGGSEAAIARWSSFRANALRNYHKMRNDAAAPGVSRMSAYLHYGHISPFRIAREALAQGGAGGKKYLDELLIWRELAYHWCDKVSDPEAWTSLPSWARESLQAEASTPRDDRYAWEQLARSKTHDALWNLAQRSLFHHGELHNNLRMTWGKMIHRWTRSPEQSLRWLIDLNHRYALDGRDPASYGGLLWCLGLFDRPFTPPKPVFGTVRMRSSQAHAKRLDVATYERHLGRDSPSRRIGVVGAGLAGLLCARTLHDHRYDVTVFDKARTPGGRSSSRISRTDDAWNFDHGAPFFHAADARVRRWLGSWEDAGVLTRWAPVPESEQNSQATETRYVGAPNNHALAQHLASDLTFQPSTRIESMERLDAGWVLRSSDAEYGPFDSVILNLPIPQLLLLWPEASDHISLPDSEPAHALMLRFDTPLDLGWDTSEPKEHPILGWICREASKPGRDSTDQWLIQSRGSWSKEHLETDLDEVERMLTAAFLEYVDAQQQPAKTQIHRWRYARASSPLQEGSLWVPESQLGACGDAWHGGIEGALLSGAHLAGTLMREEP